MKEKNKVGGPTLRNFRDRSMEYNRGPRNRLQLTDQLACMLDVLEIIQMKDSNRQIQGTPLGLQGDADQIQSKGSQSTSLSHHAK